MDGMPANQNTNGDRRQDPPPRPDAVQRLLDRLPPHSLEAEMSLLGCMILDHKAIGEVVALVPSADAFFRDTHAAIFDVLVHLFEHRNSGDLVQIVDALRDRNVLDEIGGPDYLIKLAESVPSAVNAPHYARIVREKAQLRRLIRAAEQILRNAYEAGHSDDAVREVLDSAEQQIFEIADRSVGLDSEELAALLQQTLDLLDANYQHGRHITGIATGFFDLDEMTSGLQPGEMAIVAARPSMGKTAFALNLAEQIAFGGSPHDSEGPHTPVAFFSMEMSRQAVTQRLLCAHSGVDSHKMRRNMLNNEDFDRLVRSCDALTNAPVYIDDTPGLTVLMLRAKARRMVAQYGVKCICVDYLQLMSSPHSAREGRQQEVSAISRGIKAVARELNLPVVCLAQLNRGAELREGHRPRMSDLRESGSIEQDADVIMLLHREEYYHQGDPDWALDNPDKVGVAEIIIAKQRNGPTGVVELQWDAKTTRFRNLSRREHHHAAPPRDQPAPQDDSPASVRKVSFAPGQKSGPASQHRDGGGPDRDWQEEPIDDLPI